MNLKYYKKICGYERSNYLIFLQYSLVIIPKRKRLPGCDQIGCRESGTPSINI